MGKITRNKINLQREKTKIARPRKLDRNAPDFQSFLEDIDVDPVEINTGDFEADGNTQTREELNAIIRERKQNDRFRYAKDKDFYLIICFQSNDQVKEFVQKAGWNIYGEAIFNGFDVAHQMGIEIKYEDVEPMPLRGSAKKYAPFALKSK